MSTTPKTSAPTRWDTVASRMASSFCSRRSAAVSLGWAGFFAAVFFVFFFPPLGAVFFFCANAFHSCKGAHVTPYYFNYKYTPAPTPWQGRRGPGVGE